jgi:hypothetical protein
LTYARAHELRHSLLYHAGYYLISRSTFIPPDRYDGGADEFVRASLDPAETSR